MANISWPTNFRNATVIVATEEGRDIMRANGWHSAILVTDPFHMRRATLTFRQAFGLCTRHVLITDPDLNGVQSVEVDHLASGLP